MEVAIVFAIIHGNIKLYLFVFILIIKQASKNSCSLEACNTLKLLSK